MVVSRERPLDFRASRRPRPASSWSSLSLAWVIRDAAEKYIAENGRFSGVEGRSR
jgi:hypothetical protein